MPKQPIPEREPIGEVFNGFINQQDNHFLLSKQPLATVNQIAEGDFVIRYAIPYLGKPQMAIVPDLLVLDHGDMMVGEEAWDFLINRSNLYPRADVLGYRHDGTDEMVVVKQLDFAIPFHVLTYGNASDTTPIARLSALIAPESYTYPQRLIKYLPQYITLADWQATHEQ